MACSSYFSIITADQLHGSTTDDAIHAVEDDNGDHGDDGDAYVT